MKNIDKLADIQVWVCEFCAENQLCNKTVLKIFRELKVALLGV